MAKEKGIPVFDYDSCVACGICVLSCPFDCIEMSKININKRYKTKPYPDLVKVSDCTGCAICEKDCPVNSIEMMVAVPA